ncbi:hypothetical protein [Nodosilinea sp. P-1105]|uniref:hypothetical protein n=1 Tax=Nodosilinea sp. P-1105 TaxID=2546229 RepID=UPI00146D7A84|nr:hypothetical protein [Nodosilinea sp. P-1105]NMF81931.1 hypothetical protein [Nodosilinea sp. P-1105]
MSPTAAVDEVTSRARRMWQLLAPEVQQREAAQTAVEKLAANPAATDWQQTLQLQLQGILAARPDIAAQVESIWQEGASSEATGSPISSQISVNGNQNLAVGNVSGQGRVYGNIGGSVDESRGKVTADRGSQIAGNDATRRGGNFFSHNTIMLVVIAILALGAVAWALAMRLGPGGLELEIEGGEQSEQPMEATP